MTIGPKVSHFDEDLRLEVEISTWDTKVKEMINFMNFHTKLMVVIVYFHISLEETSNSMMNLDIFYLGKTVNKD